jgi:tight adherence protein C
MGLAILTFVDIFLLIVSAGLLLTKRETRPQISAVLLAPESRSLSSTLKNARASLGNVVERFDTVLPRSNAEASVMERQLIRAGFRNDSAVKLFYGGKFLVMVIFCVVALVSGLAKFNYFFVLLFALGLGFLAPDFWLERRIASRQSEIRRGLPDLLDLLVVCVEAGLSLDQATARTTQEMNRSYSPLSDELGVVVLEQRAGCPRADAWRHLADRTDVDSVRSVVSMLIQSELFGTSIARTLRVHSETLRTQRIQQVEEQAAKTGIKILFPLVLCIFPNLFLVTLGPAIMLMMDSFKANLSQ